MTQVSQDNNSTSSKKEEIVCRLTEIGFDSKATAFEITYQDLAGYFAEVLERFQVPDDVITEAFLRENLQRVENALRHSEALPWPYVIYMLLEEGVPEQYRQWPDPDIEPDEGPFTEQYENSTRLGDDEGYYPGCCGYDDDF